MTKSQHVRTGVMLYPKPSNATSRGAYYLIKLASLTLFLFVLIAGIASAETAKEAVLALKKLEARTQAGISLRDYAPALGEAKFEVNLYLEGDANGAEMSSKIANVMELYDYANTMWGEKFKETASYGFIFINAGGIFSYSDAVALKYLKMFPEDNKSVEDGGVLYSQCNPQTVDGVVYNGCKVFVSTAVSHIWSRASDQLKEITSLLAKFGNKKKKTQVK